MIQIGFQPPLATIANGPPTGPDEEIGRHSGPEVLVDSSPPGDTGDRSSFASPLPLPFPRVFPGL